LFKIAMSGVLAQVGPQPAQPTLIWCNNNTKSMGLHHICDCTWPLHTHT